MQNSTFDQTKAGGSHFTAETNHWGLGYCVELQAVVATQCREASEADISGSTDMQKDFLQHSKSFHGIFRWVFVAFIKLILLYNALILWKTIEEIIYLDRLEGTFRLSMNSFTSVLKTTFFAAVHAIWSIPLANIVAKNWPFLTAVWLYPSR